MPEIPEVEVMRRDLEREVVGKKIKAVEVTGTRSIRRHKNKKEFVDVLTGRKITAVQRRGKDLVMKLDGTHALVVHPGVSGEAPGAEAPPGEGAEETPPVVTFPQGGGPRVVGPPPF